MHMVRGENLATLYVITHHLICGLRQGLGMARFTGGLSPRAIRHNVRDLADAWLLEKYLVHYLRSSRYSYSSRRPAA